MKLIDLLVKELPKRGGWPDGALNATQDKDGEVGFSAGAVPEFCYDAWDGGDWCGNEFHTIRASDYATAIITSEQYEAAIDSSKAVVGHEGWTEWHGGDCPVDSDEIVEVKFRRHNQHQYNNDRAGDFYWSHTGSNADIIAYRLKQPTKSEQDFDDAAGDDDEADLNECISHDVDVVNHPSHYTKGRIECIDAIDSATTGKSGIEAVCVANIIKYLYRYEEKNGIEDVKKAKWYINKLISELESK